MRCRPVLIVGGLLCAHITLAEEPTVTDCWQAVDSVQTALADWPAADPLRLEIEHRLRLAQGEGNSGDIDECLEIVESAKELLDTEKSPQSRAR